MVYNDDDLVPISAANDTAEEHDVASEAALDDLQAASNVVVAPVASQAVVPLVHSSPAPVANNISNRQARAIKELNKKIEALYATVRTEQEARVAAESATVKAKKRGGELLAEVASLKFTLKNAQAQHEASLRHERDKVMGYKLERDKLKQEVLLLKSHGWPARASSRGNMPAMEACAMCNATIPRIRPVAQGKLCYQCTPKDSDFI